MNTLLNWLTAPEWALVVKTLLHSLWQGALIAAGLALLLRSVRCPVLRYRFTLAGLATVVALVVITWGVLNAPKASTIAATPAPMLETAAPTVAAGPVDRIVVIANRTSAQPHIQWTAWLALAWLLGASVMLGRASVKIAGAEQLRRSCRPLHDEAISTLVTEARRAVKLTRQVRVAVTDRLTSPAVVGVIVPTLILPLSLITTLSPGQLRFILLHELAHIRRGDYLANLFQLFAEALLFFNPAVWWLSHQIRREREACCDALAIELSGAPADYARTLVSVAETMINPTPAAAPAFGIGREPSSLADRVQRLLVPGYRPSLRLTWRAMLVALALGGVLLAMLAVGTRETIAATTALLETKAAPTNSTSLSSPAIEPKQFAAIDPASGLPVAPAGSPTSVDPATGLPEASVAGPLPTIDPMTGLPVTAAGRPPRIDPPTSLPETGATNLVARIFKITELELARAVGDFGPVLTTNTTENLQRFSVQAGFDRQVPGRALFFSTGGGLFIRGTAEEVAKVERLLTGKSTSAATTATPTPSRQSIVSKLESIRLEQVAFENTPLSEVTRFLAREARRNNPEKGGLNFMIAPELNTGLPTAPATSPGVSPSNVLITIKPAIQKATLRTVLDAIVKASPQPIAYSIEDYGIVFKPAKTNAEPLFTRIFKVDTNAFARGPAGPGETTGLQVVVAIREFFDQLGVNLSPPKAFYYKDREGTVFVHATRADLDTIEAGLKKLETRPAVSAPINSPKQDTSTNLHTRIFRVDPNTFVRGLEDAGIMKTTNLQANIRMFFASLGADLQLPKTVFFNDRQGSLFVRATLADLDIIEQVIQVLNTVPPQVNIRAKFIEVPESSQMRKLLEGQLPATTNASIGGVTGILTEPQAKAVLRALERAEGVEILTAPDVTTVSGRQAQMSLVDIKTIVTGAPLTTNGVTTNVFQTSALPFGPVLDVIPYVNADGYTVEMSIIPTITEFLGYDRPDAVLTEYARTNSLSTTLPLPRFRVRQLTTQAIVWDSQTIVLGGFMSEMVTRRPDGSETRKPDPQPAKKQLLVFITPTIIDPAGNRAHPDEDIAKRMNAGPKQPAAGPGTPR